MKKNRKHKSRKLKNKKLKIMAIVLSSVAGVALLGSGHFIYQCSHNKDDGGGDTPSTKGIKVEFKIEGEESTTTHTKVEQITKKIVKNKEFQFKVNFTSVNYTIGEIEIKVGDTTLTQDDYTVDFDTRIVTVKENKITTNFTVKLVEKGLSTDVMINGIDYAPIGMAIHYEGVVLGGDDKTPIKSTTVTWQLLPGYPEGVTLNQFTGELYVPSGVEPDQTIKFKAIATDDNQAESEVKEIKTKVAGDYNAIGVIAWEDTQMTLLNYGDNAPDLQYSTDFETWKQVTPDTPIDIKKGNSILLKGNNPEGFCKSDTQYSTIHFKENNKKGCVELLGNVMSLIDDGAGTATEIPCDYCFYFAFSYGKNYAFNAIQYVPLDFLPATTITEHCYHNMFKLADLVYAPLLPAANVKKSCYQEMFYQNGFLRTAAPLYHVTYDEKLPDYCFDGMYCSCTLLNVVEGTTYPYAYYIFTCPNSEYLGTDSVTDMFNDTKWGTGHKYLNPGKQYCFII